ncbi:MAG: hypothetical protein HOQ32_18115 [Lysobacter sp.]|nr:hypothetical protein [Lysobacter sp.]
MWIDVGGYLIDPRHIAALGPVHPSTVGGGAVGSTFDIVTNGGHVILPRFSDASAATSARNNLRSMLPG